MTDDLNTVLASALRDAQRHSAAGELDHGDRIYQAIKNLRKIAEERTYQDSRHGVPNERGYTYGDWMVVLAEEVGEVAHAMQDGTREQIIEEVVDVAAVALAMLEAWA
jgi:hypothetical protein